MPEDNARATRSTRPIMNIPLPPKFEWNDGIEDEFLTPPIWVASNPPPMFERPEMKRTMSEVSSWGGDDDEATSTSSELPGKEEDEVQERLTVCVYSSLDADSSYNDLFDYKSEGPKPFRILV
jgi:hypothetical protein